MKNKNRPRVRVAAIIRKDDRLLVAVHEKAGHRYYVLPGGGVEFGESLEEAVARELKEEAGLDVRVGELVLANDSIPPDGHRHIINLYFLAEVTGGVLRVGVGDKRLRHVEYVTLEELAGATLYPDVREELLKGIREGFAAGPRYLGNLWRNME